MTRNSGFIVLVTLLVLLLGLSRNACAQGPAPGERSVHFLVTADLHFGAVDDDDPPTYPSYDPTTDADLQTLIDEFRNSSGDIRGILIAGDLIDSYPGENGRPSGEEQWQHYQSIRDGYSPYFYDGWGNHDSWSGWHPDELTAEIQYDVAHRGRDAPINRGDYHYSWDWDDVHFVQLNLFPGDFSDTDPHGALAWLKQDLVSRVGSSGRPVVIIHHYGFDCFSAGDLYNLCGKQGDWNGWWTEEQRVLYWAAIASYNVVAIFTGHIHGAWNCDGDPHSGCWHITWDRPDSVPPGIGPNEIHTFVAGDLGHGHGYALDVTIDGCSLEVERYQSWVWADDETVSFSGPDNDAPITSASIETGTPGENGWYTSTVEVKLTADDGGCGEGVAQTQYMIDSGSWQTYTSPVTVSSDGSHTVRFYSQDNAENLESEQQIAVSIDAIAPTGSLTLNEGGAAASSVLVRVEASASDATSGVYQMRLRNAGGSWGDWRSYTSDPLWWQLSSSPVTGQTYTVEAEFKDYAGNTSSVVSDTILLDIYPARPSSANYRLLKSTGGATGTGGSSSGSSSNYIRYDTLGQPSLIGEISSTHYALASGYWAGYKCNTAPALDASGSPALDAINEDEINNNGTLVSAIISSVLPVDMITDPDPGAVEGIALTAVDNTNGTWQYSTNGGATWSGFGTPPASAARLLASDADTRIRFVPNADWSGTVDPGLTFRAWDQFSGTNGDTADTTTNGGVTAFSSATETASITVNPVNDAPSFTKGGDQTVNEDAGLQTVSGWATNISPGPANESSQILTFTVTNNNSGLFASQPAIAANGTLTYEPAANVNGSAVVTVTLQDSGGTANGGVDTSLPQTFIITVRTAADLVVTKQAKPEPAVPGQDTITYTVVVSNPGPSSITGVTLTDDFPAEVDSPTWTCTGVACPSGSGSGHLNETLNLPENSVVTYTIAGTVAPSATSLVNTASVNTPAYETNPGDNSATVTTTLTPKTDLSISKSSERAGLAGTPITYTIVVRNAGPSDAYGAIVSDTVPPSVSGVTWSCITSGGATCGSGSGDINDTVNVPVGGVVTYTVNGTVTTDDPIVNTATVTVPAGVADPLPGNNQAVDRSGGGDIFLPIVLKSYIPPVPRPTAPDLVVDSLVATSSAVTVTLRNAGTAAVTDAFWVDVYFNPRVTPSLNHPWGTIADHGVVWGVTDPIPVGGVLVLTTGGKYYFGPPDSSAPPLPVGANVWALVDSVDYSTTYGAVQESNEGNNLYGPVVSTASVGSKEAPVVGEGQPPSMEGLPPR